MSKTATTYTNRDGSVTTTLDHSMMMDNLDFQHELTDELTTLGFTEDVDYEFDISMGDDVAQAITITNKAILSHNSITDRIADYEGRSDY